MIATWARCFADPVLSDEYLAHICRETGLNDCMQYRHPPGSRHLLCTQKKAEASLVEAVAGAIFLDAGFDGIDAVELFIENINLLEQTRRTLWQHYPEETKARIRYDLKVRGAWMGW